MGSRKQILLAIGVVALVAAGTWWLFGRAPRMPDGALASVPDGATAVGWIDVGAVRRSSLWSTLVTEQGGEASIARIEKQCDFDPLDQLRDAVVFVTGDEPRSLEHIGVVGRGDLDREALAECVGKVVEGDGGSIERADIAGVPAIAGGKGDSRAAFVARDGVAIGNEATVRGVIGVVRGEIESAATDETLKRLWERVAGGREVVVVAHVPARWRRALQQFVERGARAGATGIVDERLGGTLGPLQALGLGARVTGGLGLGVSLEMGASKHAKALVDALRGSLEGALDDPLLSLSAAGSALRAVEADVSGSEAVVTVDLRQGQVQDLVELVRERLAQGEPRAPDAHEPAEAPSMEPDEIIARDP